MEAFIEQGTGTKAGSPYENVTYTGKGKGKADIYYEEDAFPDDDFGDEYEDIEEGEFSDPEDTDNDEIVSESETDDDEGDKVTALMNAFSDSDISGSTELVRDDTASRPSKA